MEIPVIFQAPLDIFGVCNEPVTQTEKRLITSIHKEFNKAPAIDTSKIRAFRLMKGKRRWMEIGTESKANLAYMTHILDDPNLIIDIDIHNNEEGKKRLYDLSDNLNYHFLEGSSSDAIIKNRIDKILSGIKLDGLFIDGNHMFNYVFNDFASYYKYLSSDGFIFFHDIYFIGHSKSKGVAQFLSWLSTILPVYQISGDRAASLYMPHYSPETVWGGIAIVTMKDILALEKKLIY